MELLSIRNTESLKQGPSEIPKPGVIDYFAFFIQGLLEEFQSDNGTILQWLDLYQPMFETCLITSANLSMVRSFTHFFCSSQSINSSRHDLAYSGGQLCC